MSGTPKIIHPKGYKFGAKFSGHSAQAVRLSNYRDKAVQAPPSLMWDWTKVPWQMFRNGPEPNFPIGVGDCTCAEVGNTFVQWAYEGGSGFVPTDDDIIAMYSAVSGYSPANPMSDVGSDVGTVENYMLNTGIRGHKFAGVANVDITDMNEMRLALNWFRGLDIGIKIPAGLDLSNNTVWDAVKDNNVGAAEGHSARWLGYDTNNVNYCVTWAGIQAMTTAFLQQNLMMAGANLSQDMLNKQGTYNGLNMTQLMADLNAAQPSIPADVKDAFYVWWGDQAQGTRIAVILSCGLVGAFAIYMSLRAAGVL